MLCVESPFTDVYHNLALEEYFLRNFSDDIFILYVDKPCVVIGKHQNALAEINLKYVINNNIKIARRLSGGGTVYHDSGNLNFSFISTSKDNKPVNFKKFQKPVVDVLTKMGLNVEVGKRNDLSIDNLKISGNAEHVFKNRVLHHGTLLFNSNLEMLNEAINVSPEKFTDKAVQSNRSEVANISSFLKSKPSINSFKNDIMKYVFSKDGFNKMYELSDEDIFNVKQLVESKFSTWEWNFAYSPKYVFTNSAELANGELTIKMSIVKGLIEDAELKLNGQSSVKLSQFAQKLKALKHYPNHILSEAEYLPEIIYDVDNMSFFF